MARWHEVIGLNPRGERLCREARWLSDSGDGIYDAFGFSEEDSLLYSFDGYILPNGRVVVGAMQYEVWNSGPCTFLALKYEDTDEWSNGPCGAKRRSIGSPKAPRPNAIYCVRATLRRPFWPPAFEKEDGIYPAGK
jgi:hypothetical protein